MDLSFTTIDKMLHWTERLGPMTIISLGLIVLLGWIIVKMMRQYFIFIPQLPAKLQELIVAVNGLRSDVRESLKLIEAFRQGRLDHYRTIDVTRNRDQRKEGGIDERV
jgi:hypothetical protein